jgi:succinate dehydrogenase flavin-adding protein (antitoxin of CptAB toxin-antitoxin module)
MSSTRFRQTLRIAALLGAASLFAAPRARAQGMDPDQERARQLVVRIRRSMREIDSLLLSGAQPEKVEKELVANQKRIEELLKETESKSESVIKNIDELVSLTKT